MLGAELNAAIQEEWPASDTHAKRFRWWLEEKAESLNGSGTVAAPPAAATATTAEGDATS
jgi:membrane protein